MTLYDKKPKKETGAEPAGEKPVYKASHEKELEELYDKISARPEFSYAPEEDGLYRQYRDDYIRQGRLAMKDGMGQASALTGGYGSSYAQSVGQQHYDAYLGRMGEVLPELYQLAYSKYSAEGDGLERQYGMLRDLRDEEYGRYTRELERYDEEKRLEYEREKDALAFREKQEEQSYTRKLNEAAALAKYGDFSGYAAIYGQETAARMKEFWIADNPDAAYSMGLVDAGRYFAMTGKYAPGMAVQSGSSGGSKSYYPSTAPDGRDAALVQRELRNQGYNIAVDGAWGPRSQAAWEKAYGSASSGKLPELGADKDHLVWV